MNSRISALYKTLFLNAALILTVAAPQWAAAASLSEVDRQTITIWSQGVRLEADLYKPKDLKDNVKLPGLLLVPGWGGSKNNLQKNFAPHFAKQGFIVLAFDFKSWGKSDGPVVPSEPMTTSEESVEVALKATHYRKIINPLSMSEDVRAALHYLGSEPQVMPNNLGIWGTSMGGAIALVTAATDDRIKAYISQMGPVNYKHNLKSIPDTRIRYAEAMIARGKLPPFPGPDGTKNPELRGYPDWVAMKRFNPMSYLDSLRAPTLIIDAEQETLFDIKQNGQLMHSMIKGRVDSRYVVYPVKHYDMYEGEYLNAARMEAIAWFLKHLKK
jgi:dipeptidyl aminopeptidase/acylaminoacyl peptidase